MWVRERNVKRMDRVSARRRACVGGGDGEMVVGGAIYRILRVWFFRDGAEKNAMDDGAEFTACDTPKQRYVPERGGGGGVRC